MRRPGLDDSFGSFVICATLVVALCVAIVRWQAPSGPQDADRASGPLAPAAAVIAGR